MSDDFTVLRAKVIQAHVAVEAACDNALDYAIAAGNALNEIIRHDLVKYGQRKAFFKEVCGSSRTAQTYCQLDKHRDLLAEKRRGSARLSIAAALRHIREAEADRKPKRTRTSKPGATAKTAEVKNAKPEAPLPDFSEMTNQEWTKALMALGPEKFLKVMPRDWVAFLQDRLLGAAKAKLKLPAVLEEIGFDHFYNNMPRGWRAEMGKRLSKQPNHSSRLH